TALNYNTTGGANTAVGVNAGLSNNTGSHDTFLGSSADACGDGYGYSTAIGFGAIVCESNAIALGGTGTYAVKVGIGTGSPSTPLQVLNGVTSDGIPSGSDSISGACGGSFCRAIVGDSSASDGIGVEGNASGTGGVGIVANSPSGTGQAAQLNGNVNVSKDLFVTGSVTAASYVTSSSRRWKANIRPLRDSLGTVEQLRGVSYDWQSTGQHQIGVIAEEVVKVLPEVVALDPKDGSPVGVDYSRLTAVLVEAVKQQQKEILQLQREVKRLRAEKK
ncbi:MAG TPA: tail fiber domain-containing protein, partial [Terriglobia bacterium]|nr:tail fiber domain-containing protein [Terriglobia bacterium]